MIEISLGKMVLLALIALIVLVPEKLPGAARTAGALLRRVRSGWDNVRCRGRARTGDRGNQAHRARSRGQRRSGAERR
jgi:Sec-independent protein translocase protein TatA